MTDTTYNGWKNYPTWAVNLWLSNDRGTYEFIREGIQEIGSSPRSTSEYWTLGQSRLYNAADWLKEVCTNGEDYGLIPDLGASMASDILGWAMDQVDWNEVATSWLEGVEA